MCLSPVCVHATMQDPEAGALAAVTAVLREVQLAAIQRKQIAQHSSQPKLAPPQGEADIMADPLQQGLQQQGSQQAAASELPPPPAQLLGGRPQLGSHQRLEEQNSGFGAGLAAQAPLPHTPSASGSLASADAAGVVHSGSGLSSDAAASAVHMSSLHSDSGDGFGTAGSGSGSGELAETAHDGGLTPDDVARLQRRLAEFGVSE